MDAHSPKLVSDILDLLKSVEDKDRKQFNLLLSKIEETMKVINFVFDSMWYRVNPASYNDFRTFIFGTKNQPMFPNGLLYEGVDESPRTYRGETGANDNIIPTLDNLF
jgi:indoleamine 2,3-dioxygenase